MDDMERRLSRRNALAWLLRAGAGAVVAGFAAKAASRPSGGRTVWQIDPRKCIQCGKCETECVLQPSAVKCVHGYAMCGYCKLCFGYFKPDAARLDEAAEKVALRKKLRDAGVPYSPRSGLECLRGLAEKNRL